MPSIQDLYKRFPPIAALKQAISRGGNAMERLSNLPGNQRVRRFFEPTEQVRTRDFIRELPGAAKTIAKTFYQEPARYTTSLLQRPVLGQDVFTPQTKFEKFFLRDEPIKSAETSYFAQKARERGASEGKAANIGRFAVVGGLLADVSGAGRAKGAAKAFALANDAKMVEKVAAKAKIKLTPELTDFLVKEKNPEKIATTLAEYLTTKGVKAIPKELEPLAKEARKYKSAEEFVKAQTNVYHGSNQEIKTFNQAQDYGLHGGAHTDFGVGTYFSDNPNYAKRYGVAITPSAIDRSVNFYDLTKNDRLSASEARKLYLAFKDHYKQFGIPVPEDFKVRAGDLKSVIFDNMKGSADITDGDISTILSKAGFGGVKFKERLLADVLQGKGHRGNEFVVFDHNKIKTKAQLIDLYNQATGAKVGKVLPPSNIQQAKAVPPELEPLAKEARIAKIDSAGRKIIEEKNGIKIAVNDIKNPSYVTLWDGEKKIGELRTSNKAIYGADDYIQIGSVEIDKKYRNQGLATELYKTLIKYAPEGKKGIVGYYPDIVAKKAISRIYEKLGGRLDKETGNYYIDFYNQATGAKVGKTGAKVGKVLPPSNIQQAKAIPKELEPLAKEARKYKSAEEFANERMKKMTAKSLFNVGDVVDTGGGNLQTIIGMEGNGVRFRDSKGVEYAPFSKSTLKNILTDPENVGTSWRFVRSQTKSQLIDLYNQATGAKVGKTGAIPPVGNTQSPQSKTPLTQTRGIDQATPQLLSTPLGKSVGVPSQTSIPQETISGVPTVGKQGGDLIRKGKVKAPYIAVRKTPSGKEVLAVRRDSGVFAPKDVETHNFRSGAIGKTDNLLSFAATLDNIPQDQLGKKGFGPMMRLYDQVSTAEATKTKFANEIKQKIAQVLVKNGLNREGSLIVRELAEGGRPAGATQAHVRAAQEIRGILDDLHKQANAVRTKMGKEPIGYLENYWTRVRESSLWQDVIRNDKNTSISDAFDFIVPNEKANPFAKQRVLELAQQPRAHPLKEMDAYVDAIANDIYLTPQIESIKAHAEVLKGRGMLKEANWLGEYIRNNLVGKPAKALTALDVTGKVPQKIMGKVTQARNIGALSFNITWSLLTQPASIVNTVARAGLKNTLRGTLDWFTNPALQKEIMQTPTMVRKTARGIGTTLGGDVDRTSQALYKGSIDKVNDVLGIFSNALEKHLTGASIAAGLRRADKLGIKGTDRRMFAEYIGQTTQSMYDAVGRPLILNPKETRLLFPFQTFANEMFRYARTLAGKGGGIPLAKRERMGQAISVIVGMYLWNQYTQAMGGRAIGSVGTFIPFAGSEVDKRITEVKDKVTGLIRGEPVQGQASGRAPIAPFEDADKIIRAVITFIETGDWQPLRRELTFWGMGLAGIGGATQLNRTIDGLIAAEKGYSETSTGRVRFPVKGTAEKIKAIIGGPYATKAGKEYIKGGFKTLGDVQSEVFKASGGSNFDKVKADREAKKELDALKSGKQAKTGLFGKKPTTPTVRDGIVELSNGKFAYQVGDEWKTANDRDTAKLEVAKDAFKKSNKNFQEFGDYVLRRNEDGSIKTQRKTAYEIEKGEATLTNLKNKKDVKGWLEAAKKQAQRIIKEMEADYTDEVERLKLENQLRILMNQYEKYSSYGGFTKPKKGRKLSGVRTTVNRPSFAKSKAIRAKVKAPKFASISPSKRAAVAFRSPVRKPSASRRAMGGGRSRIRIMGRAKGLV